MSLTSNTLSNEPALEIHWTMTLPAHADFYFFCAGPLKVESDATSFTLQLDALAPIRLRSKHKLVIHPPFTKAFAPAFNNLPDELKVMILKHNLILNVVVSDYNTVSWHLLPYLRMTPKIAALAQEIFYKDNNFQAQISPLGYDPSIDRAYRMKYAPQPINHSIRHLYIDIEMCQDNLDKLTNLANGMYGFSALQIIKISVDVAAFLRTTASPIGFLIGYHGSADWDQTVPFLPWLERHFTLDARFKAKGSLRIFCDRGAYGYNGPDRHLCELKEFLNNRITFEVAK
jgi:hypothetical protein